MAIKLVGRQAFGHQTDWQASLWPPDASAIATENATQINRSRNRLEARNTFFSNKTQLYNLKKRPGNQQIHKCPIHETNKESTCGNDIKKAPAATKRTQNATKKVTRNNTREASINKRAAGS